MLIEARLGTLAQLLLGRVDPRREPPHDHRKTPGLASSMVDISSVRADRKEALGASYSPNHCGTATRHQAAETRNDDRKPSAVKWRSGVVLACRCLGHQRVGERGEHRGHESAVLQPAERAVAGDYGQRPPSRSSMSMIFGGRDRPHFCAPTGGDDDRHERCRAPSFRADFPRFSDSRMTPASRRLSASRRSACLSTSVSTTMNAVARAPPGAPRPPKACSKSSKATAVITQTQTTPPRVGP